MVFKHSYWLSGYSKPEAFLFIRRLFFQRGESRLFPLIDFEEILTDNAITQNTK